MIVTDQFLSRENLEGLASEFEPGNPCIIPKMR